MVQSLLCHLDVDKIICFYLLEPYIYTILYYDFFAAYNTVLISILSEL